MDRWTIALAATVLLAGCAQVAPDDDGQAPRDPVASSRDVAAGEPDGAARAPIPPSSRPSGDGEPGASAASPSRQDAAAPTEFSGAAIPARFHGVYAAEGACGRPGDESRLEIASGTVRFHESGGPVIRASGEGDELTVALRLTGEGETRDAEYRFRREDGGARLVDAAGGMVRMRCAERARS